MKQNTLLRSACFLALGLATALTGCARISAVSQVGADGSLRRTLTYNGTVADKGNDQAAMPGTNMDDLIALPTKASGYTVTRQAAKGSELTVTATKTLPVGTTGRNDLGIKLSPKGAGASNLLLENAVSVRQTAPGTLEYRETLHWKGDPKEAFGTEPAPELLSVLRKALPPEVATDTASARKAALALQAKLWQTMMGPGEPVLPLLVFHPDYAQYRMTAELAGSVNGVLTDVYASRLTAVQRAQIVQKLVSEATKTALSKTDSQKQSQAPGGGDASKSPTLIPLFFRVQMPSKITATNGETGATPGEVVWPVYSSAAAGGDITLTATCVIRK